MKISSETRSVLKNFATINSGIKVESGNQLKTISQMKNILQLQMFLKVSTKSLVFTI